MAAFLLLCLAASVFSIVHWMRKPPKKSAAAAAGN
jgi:hypothetical protein